MEARRQYYDPVRDSRAGEQYFPLDPELLSEFEFNHPSDIQIEPHPPAGQDALQFLPIHQSPADESQLHVDDDEDRTPKIEFSTQWNNRKEAVWDIVGPKRGTQALVSALAPQARAAPRIWAENIYDAQDVLPYFAVGQTILASKIPRAVSRSILLTRNLHDICTDWRSGKIGFTVQVRYKLQLNRPKKWKAPSWPSKLVNVDCKPMDPIQFRKLRACYEGGIPVRILATGDFPSLPTFQSSLQEKWESDYSIESSNWQNGVVMLGFFWVKKVVELEHSPEKEDIETGKCSGRSKWAFEFLSCDINEQPPWWCPIGDDMERGDDSMRDDEGWEPENASKRRRVEECFDPALCTTDIPMWNVAEWTEEGDRSNTQAILDYPYFDCPMDDWASHRTDPIPDERYAHTEINAPPSYLPNITELPVSTATGINSQISDPKKSPAVSPKALGLSLEPIVGNELCLSRAPKLRASLLLGWHCLTCGRLNPRKKWFKIQSCPLCKTISNTLVLPEWHRRAHTEAVGPIGTLFRLDDGGHQPKTGLHQMAARDEETGLTFVEYWLAEAPMPIIAELNRTSLVDRRRTRKNADPPKMLEAPHPDMALSTDAPAPGLITATPTPSTLVPSIDTQIVTPDIKDGTHPDGGDLIRQRDPGGSRAVFSEDTRMLFMHITRPQHPAGLAVVDQIFSGFATDVQMERQENSAEYRTGASILSCHYTYLAGYGTHIMHTSSPAVDWEEVPACVYDAHALLVNYQTHTVFDDNETIREFNQSIYIMGNGAPGTSSFRIIHKAEDGPVGYMVFGASCSIEILVGNGDNAKKKTTKGGATRRAELLLAHGDALMTMPTEGDAPLQIRVKRTGLAVVSIARYVGSVSAQVETAQAVPQKKRLLPLKKSPMPSKRDVTPAKRKARTPSARLPDLK